jgi:hypothetical protein
MGQLHHFLSRFTPRYRETSGIISNVLAHFPEWNIVDVHMDIIKGSSSHAKWPNEVSKFGVRLLLFEVLANPAATP